nr:HNH endonuclease signature motif containing protein [Microbacterium bovistercoris]
MSILGELERSVAALSAHSELACESTETLAAMRMLGGDGASQVIDEATAIRDAAERLVAVAAAVIVELSARERGHGGFAASKGSRNAADYIQSITGGTRADAVRAVRLGDSLLEADAGATPDDPEAGERVPGGPEPSGPGGSGEPEPSGPDGPERGATDVTAAPADRTAAGGGDPGDSGDDASEDGAWSPGRPWHDGLRRAMLRGRINTAAHDAILRGLGAPRVAAGEEGPSATMAEVWAIAAEQLMRESTALPVEELVRRARQVRDSLDPAGAEERFLARYRKRAFRTWTDAEGQHHGHITFDDEMAAWVRTISGAALRPRRGGPRFVDPGEADAAEALARDPRTNDQLAYDLLMDVLRAGALADAKDVFGARQPGVRMVFVQEQDGPRDAFGRMLRTGHLEDGGDTIPSAIIERNACTTGTIRVTVDSCGNPLDVGREQRLYTPAQRIALAIRDGGCLWPGCDRPASYCEAHHIDLWSEDGRTDIGRGILLCRFHHMNLHHNGWRITREGTGVFLLHPPGGAPPIALASNAGWKWSFDPPPDRVSWRRPPAMPERMTDRAPVHVPQHVPDRVPERVPIGVA